MVRIYKLIQAGAKAFLFAEYALCAIFIVLFGALVLVATAHKNKGDSADGKEWDFKFGGLTAFSFVVGSVTSIISGYIGMMVAVYVVFSNVGENSNRIPQILRTLSLTRIAECDE